MSILWDRNLVDNPRKWIQYAFPWGDPDTPLANVKEPRAMQIEVCEEIADHIRNNRTLVKQGLQPKVYRGSTSSGRGVGKSALYEGLLPIWFLSVVVGGTIITTANNETQLNTRTWAELGIWHNLAINSHWFSLSTEKMQPSDWFSTAIRQQLRRDTRYYYNVAQLWQKDNPSSFAGIHSQQGLMVVFAEATGIPDPIWTVARGFFTEPTLYRFFFASSNPRKATGAFYETHHKERKLWYRRIIDSRTVPGLDRAELDAIVEKHGEHSPEACAEVTGQFPDASDKQFIARSLVDGASARALFVDKAENDGAPIIIGADVARHGDDQSVAQPRVGRDARTIPALVFEGINNVQFAGRLLELADRLSTAHFHPNVPVHAQRRRKVTVNIDLGGGAGVIDILKDRAGHLAWIVINEIDFGSKADEPDRWANKRTEMYAHCRSWLPGGCIANDQELKDDLTGPEYYFRSDSSVVQLEPKESMKKRGLSSPDRGDALVLTFAVHVPREDPVPFGSSLDKARRGGARIADGVDDPVL